MVLEDSHVKNISFVTVLKHANVLAVVYHYPFYYRSIYQLLEDILARFVSQIINFKRMIDGDKKNSKGKAKGRVVVGLARISDFYPSP